MNIRIFWVRAMKCMCVRTRPRFILSSEGVLGGMEFEPMLTPREKSPLPENVPWGGSNPWHCGQRAQALPTELFRPPCHVVWRESSATKFDRAKIAFFLALFYWLNYQLIKEERKPEKTRADELQKMPHTVAQKFKPQLRLEPALSTIGGRLGKNTY